MILDNPEKITSTAETVGSKALQLLKCADPAQSVIETQRAMQSKYVDSLVEAAKKAEAFYGTSKPFYICVQTRRERLLTNVIRNQFYTRQTRPLPQYDLSLYWYNPKEERIEFVWCIPDKESVSQIVKDGQSGLLPPDQRELFNFCKAFKDGTLI